MDSFIPYYILDKLAKIPLSSIQLKNQNFHYLDKKLLPIYTIRTKIYNILKDIKLYKF